MFILCACIQAPLTTKIAVIGGTGAVGSYFSTQLTNHPYTEVSIIGRRDSQNLSAVTENGLTLKTSEGEKVFPRSTFHSIDAVGHEKQDMIIVSLKQPDMTISIAQHIMGLAHGSSIIGFIGNGLPFYFLEGLAVEGKDHIESVDAQGEIISQFKNAQIIGIQPIIAAEILSPGKVQITRPWSKVSVVIGALRKPLDLTLVAALFNASGIPTTVTESIHKIIMEKQQFALAINVLSALLEKTIGEVFDDPNTLGLTH